jgi:hypothetical protein
MTSAARFSRIAGGIAALAAVIVFRRWLSAELGMLQAGGMLRLGLDTAPVAVQDWFALLRSSRLVGLVLLNAFDLVNYVLAAVMYAGICSLVEARDRGWARLAAALVGIGLAVQLASSQALTVLSLGGAYGHAGDAQRAAILGAGQYALAVNDPATFGTGLFWSWLLFYGAGLTLSILMARGRAFPRWVAVLGIVACSFGLGYLPASLAGHAWVVVPAIGSALANLVWYVAVGIRLLRNRDAEPA